MAGVSRSKIPPLGTCWQTDTRCVPIRWRGPTSSTVRFTTSRLNKRMLKGTPCIQAHPPSQGNRQPTLTAWMLSARVLLVGWPKPPWRSSALGGRAFVADDQLRRPEYRQIPEVADGDIPCLKRLSRRPGLFRTDLAAEFWESQDEWTESRFTPGLIVGALSHVIGQPEAQLREQMEGMFWVSGPALLNQHLHQADHE